MYVCDSKFQFYLSAQFLGVRAARHVEWQPVTKRRQAPRIHLGSITHQQHDVEDERHACVACQQRIADAKLAITTVKGGDDSVHIGRADVTTHVLSFLVRLDV
jgi:hypothetical protein